MVAHGTDIPAGLGIVHDGHFVASISGKCGSGVYGLGIEEQFVNDRVDILKTIQEAWTRTKTGGYNRAWCIIHLLFIDGAHGY